MPWTSPEIHKLQLHESNQNPLHIGLLTSLGCSYIRHPRWEEKMFLIARRTSFRVQHINQKLVLHIHFLHHINMYTLSFIHLHILLWCTIGFISTLISTPFKILQLNSDTNTRVPIDLSIKKRNRGILLASLLNYKYILDIIMHIPPIILPRSTK